MFLIAILIGLYSYSIFFLGLAGLLNTTILAVDSVIFITISFYLFKNVNFVKRLEQFIKWLKQLPLFEKTVILLTFLLVIVNFIGALGPELSFDALWYHLTLPKIYLLEERLLHIPGGLLYYSDMPKLVEMLYVPLLAFGNEIAAKVIHFSLGILSLIVIYRICRLFLSKRLSLLAILIFYSNLVVAWLSITAYIDLGRAFFEILSLYYFILFLKQRKPKFLWFAGLVLGFAISSKLLALGSILIFITLLLYSRAALNNIFKFVSISLVIPLPWFIFSFINTGNPLFPFFTPVYDVSVSFNLFDALKNFIHSPDPLSPIFLIMFPMVIFAFNKFGKLEKVIALYCLFAFLLWILTPQTGGGRFIAAYLPAMSVLACIVLKYINTHYLRNYVMSLILLISLTSIIYRGAANAKYIPVVLGLESKDEFLTQNLNFSFGDFYDTDGYFKESINNTDRVLIYGVHNLYYVNFPFYHESWYRGQDINYVLIRGEVPVKYKNLLPIYANEKSGVKLYEIK